MPKCCRCGKEGEIGVELIYHNNHEEGEIILCYNCHKKEHPEFSKKKMKTLINRLKPYHFLIIMFLVGIFYLNVGGVFEGLFLTLCSIFGIVYLIIIEIFWRETK